MPSRRSSDMQFCLGAQFLDLFSLKDAPGADDEGIDRGSGEVKLGASLLWTSICDDDKMDDVTIRTRTGMHTLPFAKKLEILEYTFNQARRL